MPDYSCPKNINKTITKYILLIIFSSTFLFFSRISLCAADSSESEFQKEAKAYRSQGIEKQKVGNLEEALSLYQKAIELDPAYAVVYNDLGVIYEAKGNIEQAESYYQKCLTISPDYLSAYSNLALLYENKGELDKAAFYWKKRADLGASDDPWTVKAKSKLDKLMPLAPSLRENYKRLEMAELERKVQEQKRINKEEEIRAAHKHFEEAKKFYGNAEYNKAKSEVEVSLSLNPEDESALKLTDLIKKRIAEEQQREKEKERAAKEKTKKLNIQNMQAHFESGIKYFQQDNPQAAKKEFIKLQEIATSSQGK